MPLGKDFYTYTRRPTSETTIRIQNQDDRPADCIERNTLLGNHRSTSLRKDESPFVSSPMSISCATCPTLACNYVNVLLVFVPLGIIAGAVGLNPPVVFVLNFLAIVPLAVMLSFVTEELWAASGQTIGGLINATSGTAVQLIISAVALKNGEIRIVQSSILGSILANILLVPGCCFFASSMKCEQRSNKTVASTAFLLIPITSVSLIIPATLHASLSHSDENNILILSYGTAIILLILYILYLYFRLETHASLFDEEQQTESELGKGTRAQIISPIAARIALVIITVITVVCAEYLIDSIDSIVRTGHISKTFIGLVLLPFIGNSAGHMNACVLTNRNKVDLAISVAIGSSMQIALFVSPCLVGLGWIIGQPMTLQFQGFEIMVFLPSVLVANYIIQDGKSNFVESAMRLGLYIIIALAVYLYSDNAGDITKIAGKVLDNST